MGKSGSGLERIARRINRPVKVIGLGGVGSAVAQALVQFVSARRAGCTLWLIDGDTYEERNRERVMFHSYENKAVAKAEEFTRACASCPPIIPVPRYVTPGNVRRLITDGDIIFLCVDNHATRRLVSNRFRRLKDGILFAGGNDGIEEGREGTYGNVQVYIRRGGRDVSNPLTRFHPEIARPRDKRPDELGCAALSGSAPQLLFTNLAVASAMLGAFYAWLRRKLDYEEIYLDIGLGKMTPVRRALARRSKDRTGSR